MKSEMAGKTRHMRQEFLLSVRVERAINSSRYACCAPVFLFGRDAISVGAGTLADAGDLPGNLHTRLPATDLEVGLYFLRC